MNRKGSVGLIFICKHCGRQTEVTRMFYPIPPGEELFSEDGHYDAVFEEPKPLRKKPTKKQMIKFKCKQLGIEPPKNLDKMTEAEAEEYHDGLLQKEFMEKR